MTTNPNAKELCPCPLEQSTMTPCIAWIGRLALTDEALCVGCGITPTLAIATLALNYQPAAREANGLHTAWELADRLMVRVAECVVQQQPST